MCYIRCCRANSVIRTNINKNTRRAVSGATIQMLNANVGTISDSSENRSVSGARITIRDDLGQKNQLEQVLKGPANTKPMTRLLRG